MTKRRAVALRALLEAGWAEGGHYRWREDEAIPGLMKGPGLRLLQPNHRRREHRLWHRGEIKSSSVMAQRETQPSEEAILGYDNNGRFSHHRTPSLAMAQEGDSATIGYAQREIQPSEYAIIGYGTGAIGIR